VSHIDRVDLVSPTSGRQPCERRLPCERLRDSELFFLALQFLRVMSCLVSAVNHDVVRLQIQIELKLSWGEHVRGSDRNMNSGEIFLHYYLARFVHRMIARAKRTSWEVHAQG